MFSPFANWIYNLYKRPSWKRIVSFCYSQKWGCLVILVFKGCMIFTFDVLLVKLEISWQRYQTPLNSFFHGSIIVLCLTQLNRPKLELHSLAPLVHLYDSKSCFGLKMCLKKLKNLDESTVSKSWNTNLFFLIKFLIQIQS